jgi:hypothetical protein
MEGVQLLFLEKANEDRLVKSWSTPKPEKFFEEILVF